MKREQAEEIFDLLVRVAGMNPNKKEYFVLSLQSLDHIEFRFEGLLGFGGKFHTDHYCLNPRISCYPEDTDILKEMIIRQVNVELDKMIIFPDVLVLETECARAFNESLSKLVRKMEEVEDTPEFEPLAEIYKSQVDAGIKAGIIELGSFVGYLDKEDREMIYKPREF